MKVETPWLAGWQEIASYLRVSVRTAQMRAEKEGLPILQKTKRGVVKAHKSDLDEWVRKRNGAQPSGNLTQPKNKS